MQLFSFGCSVSIGARGQRQQLSTHQQSCSLNTLSGHAEQAGALIKPEATDISSVVDCLDLERKPGCASETAKELLTPHIGQIKRPRWKTTPQSRWEMLPIGLIESPYYEKYQIPKQPTIIQSNNNADGSGMAEGKIVLFPGYEECIANLEGFDYIWVISYLHLNSGFKTKIRPQPLGNAAKRPPQQVGLFSSRAPHRPNPIAISALQVTSVNVSQGIIHVKGLDLINDTPILDIKPYIPAFDSFPDAKAGWMDEIQSSSADARIHGYQNIESGTGKRSARTFRKKLAEMNDKIAGTDS